MTVSQLNRYIKAVLEEDGKLAEIYVRGEISNFNCHFRSGHCYFSLKDADATVRAVMFRSHAQDLRFTPENGMSVLARASVGVYERDGAYQLYVTDLQPEGAGALAVAFEQRKARLAAQGLFEEQHKLPVLGDALRVGIVTSETGAALQDILSVLTRRNPLCTAVLCAATVQGDDAPRSLIAALKALDARGGCDVIIIGRGGGSAEDLWCFNDIALAHAIFACTTPVISAVGHETDWTICDFVADLRAPTPSAAAELAVQSMDAVRGRLFTMRDRLQRKSEQMVAVSRERLERAGGHPVMRSPMRYIIVNKEKLVFSTNALYNKKRIIMQKKKDQLLSCAKLLDSLSPLRVLTRGYCIVSGEDESVRSAASLNSGEQVRMRFHDGVAEATVNAINRTGDRNE